MNTPLRAIGVFHAVARAGSISKAAGLLGVTPSAVSQQIKVLEIHLGTALVTKVGRHIKLTEAGERYFEMIDEEIDRVVEATGRLRGHHVVPVLTVRATPSLSTKFLLPRLPSFLEQFPDQEVHIDAPNESTDFSREGVDLEIRHGEGRWPGLFVEPLAEEHIAPMCSPAYAAPASLDAEELPAHRLIHSVKAQVQWTHFFTAAGVTPNARWRRILFDRSHMSVDAAARGMGIALESNLMMERELRDGALTCPVRHPPTIRIQSQWIVCPNENLRHRRVRTLIDWLRSERDAWAKAERVRLSAGPENVKPG